MRGAMSYRSKPPVGISTGNQIHRMKTFWRMKLYSTLRTETLLTNVKHEGGVIRLKSSLWDDYWGEFTHEVTPELEKLKDSWQNYIHSDFSLAEARPYCEAYFDLLGAILRLSNEFYASGAHLLGRVLGFENFTIEESPSSSIAGATTSFRNPVFLSLQTNGIRRNDRNDPRLLPLIVANTRNGSSLFYHYRKQRIIKNSDDNLLVFPAVEMKERAKSFGCLSSLTNNLMGDWDSRLQQRTTIMVESVLSPLLQETTNGDGSKPKAASLRILDIGSGSGTFTSKIVNTMLADKTRSIQDVNLTLVDANPPLPENRLQTYKTLSESRKVEYVAKDYREWLCEASAKLGEQYDFAFLFRILHNMSMFIVGSAPCGQGESPMPSRYPFVEYLSDYFQSIGVLFPDIMAEQNNADGTFVPQRKHNPFCLLDQDGGSIIERLSALAKGIIIEDSDLSASALVDHMAKYNLSHLSVYDLSPMLRLSVNHIYWIAPVESQTPWPGAKIWPN